MVEITETSLALIEAVKRFKVRHRPGYQLKIRIGIHTGTDEKQLQTDCLPRLSYIV